MVWFRTHVSMFLMVFFVVIHLIQGKKKLLFDICSCCFCYELCLWAWVSGQAHSSAIKGMFGLSSFYQRKKNVFFCVLKVYLPNTALK